MQGTVLRCDAGREGELIFRSAAPIACSIAKGAAPSIKRSLCQGTWEPSRLSGWCCCISQNLQLSAMLTFAFWIWSLRTTKAMSRLSDLCASFLWLLSLWFCRRIQDWLHLEKMPVERLQHLLRLPFQHFPMHFQCISFIFLCFQCISFFSFYFPMGWHLHWFEERLQALAPVLN